MNKKILVLLTSFVIMVVAAAAISLKLYDKSQEIERIKIELAHAQIASPIQVDTIHDSIPVYTSSVISVKKGSYKKELVDKKLLKELDLQPKQVIAQQKSGSDTRDTVKLICHSNKINVFSYRDRWASFHLSLSDSNLIYSVRDSVVTIICRQYKHRLLWWRWGTKGYKVKVINFNPHSTLLYNQFISVD